MALSLHKSIIHWRLVPSTSLPQKALMDIDIALGALSIGALREYALLGIVLSLTKRLWIMCLVRQNLDCKHMQKNTVYFVSTGLLKTAFGSKKKRVITL